VNGEVKEESGIRQIDNQNLKKKYKKYKKLKKLM
jgi:hypothetical protein